MRWSGTSSSPPLGVSCLKDRQAWVREVQQGRDHRERSRELRPVAASCASDALAETLLQLFPAPAAQAYFRAAVHDDYMLTARVWLDFLHLLEIHNCGAMHSKEHLGIKLGFQLVHSFAQQVRLAQGMNACVVVGRLDPQHIRCFQK